MVHRDDIQGLRGVAVLLVVLGHAGVPFLGGGYIGVDVFFVLSGFVITGLLLAQARKRGSISLVQFYGRRARRILPAAGLTLVVTTLAAYFLLNFVRARDAAVDSIWASVFAANVNFARDGSDYFAQGQPPSPVEHFWSLAVEEQFYLVWPALLSVALLVGLRGRGTRPGFLPTRRLLLVVGVVGAASLAWSIHSTEVEPTSAYYSTLARGWELALGAALAIAAVSLSRMRASVLGVLGWAGIAGIGAAAMAFSGSTPFPGYAAVLPALATALVIAAGLRDRRPRLGVGRLLSVPPLRYVGDRSYAFYLWHWPVLVIAAEYVGHELSLGANLVLLAGAFALSVFSYRFFENPIRRGQGLIPRLVIVSPVTAAAALGVALFTFHLTSSTAARYEAAAAAVRPVAFAAPTASVARSGPLPAVVAAVRAAKQGAPLPSPLTPAVGNLRGDFYDFPDGCTPGGTATRSRVCRLGAQRSAKTIVVLGDSHAQMWMPTILRFAQRDGWVVVPFVKVGCIPDFWTNRRGPCAEWLRWAKREAAKLRPQVTLIIGSWAATRPTRPPVRGVSALSAAARRFSMKVIIVGDAPHQRRDPADCLLARVATMRTCTTTATKADFQADAAIAAAARKRGIGFVDARGWFCARSSARRANYLCPLVVGQTITAVDKGHMGQTYGLQLVQPFRAALMRELLR